MKNTDTKCDLEDLVGKMTDDNQHPENLSDYCCGNGCNPCILESPAEPNEALQRLMNTPNDELFTNKKPSILDKLRKLWYTYIERSM